MLPTTLAARDLPNSALLEYSELRIVGSVGVEMLCLYLPSICLGYFKHNMKTRNQALSIPSCVPHISYMLTSLMGHQEDSG